MAMSYNVAAGHQGDPQRAGGRGAYPIPPGVVGHVPDWKSSIKYDPAGANALLDKFGYRKGADGWRTLPDGKPLSSRCFAARHAGPPAGRDVEEVARRHRRPDGRAQGQIRRAPEDGKAVQGASAGPAAWIADYPDGDNFMQLLYGPEHRCQSNNGCAKIPEYDALYAKTARMPPGPERDKLYQEMTRICRSLRAHGGSRSAGIATNLLQPRVAGLQETPDPARAVAISGRCAKREVAWGIPAVISEGPNR